MYSVERNVKKAMDLSLVFTEENTIQGVKSKLLGKSYTYPKFTHSGELYVYRETMKDEKNLYFIPKSLTKIFSKNTVSI